MLIVLHVEELKLLLGGSLDERIEFFEVLCLEALSVVSANVLTSLQVINVSDFSHQLHEQLKSAPCLPLARSLERHSFIINAHTNFVFGVALGVS